MGEEVGRYSELVSITVSRLAKIWEAGEGSLTIKITDDKGKRAKIEGGETDRV